MYACIFLNIRYTHFSLWVHMWNLCEFDKRRPAFVVQMDTENTISDAIVLELPFVHCDLIESDHGGALVYCTLGPLSTCCVIMFLGKRSWVRRYNYRYVAILANARGKYIK